MYDRVVSNIDSHMTTVAYAITRLDVIKTHAVSYTALCAGRMRQRYTECCIYRHYKSGTIRTICQAASTVYIRISNKLTCIICNGLSIGSGRSAVVAIA